MQTHWAPQSWRGSILEPWSLKIAELPASWGVRNSPVGRGSGAVGTGLIIDGTRWLRVGREETRRARGVFPCGQFLVPSSWTWPHGQACSVPLTDVCARGHRDGPHILKGVSGRWPCSALSPPRRPRSLGRLVGRLQLRVRAAAGLGPVQCQLRAWGTLLLVMLSLPKPLSSEQGPHGVMLGGSCWRA